MINLKKICKEIEIGARETGAFILKESREFDISRTESKGFNNFVSYVDKVSEKMLVEKLGTLLPEAGYITEEGTITKSGLKYCWVIDPLDGTTNFLHGLHPYAISIGLMEYDEVVAGVVFEIIGNEVFTAWKDGGAWLNGKPIHVSKAKKLADSLISLTYFCRHTHGIRRFGSAAVDLAYVACGRFEVFYEYGLHPWDVAAGIILVREAGGHISDFSGVQKNLTGEEIVAANNGVFSEVLEIVSNFMKN
jgi:myo-inositol-1(or 4)-monophosphatase